MNDERYLICPKTHFVLPAGTMVCPACGERGVVTMAAELNQPASQATENIPELDVKLEQDVAK